MTADNTATQQEYVKIEVKNADGTTTNVWGHKAGEKDYAVNNNINIETGYYAFVLDGNTYYAKAGKQNAAQLIAVAKEQGYNADAVTGTYYKWTYDNGNGETVVYREPSSTTAVIDPATYATKELTTGYFKLTVTGSSDTNIVTVNTEIVKTSECFVTAADTVIATANGQVKDQWGAGTNQPIAADITVTFN